MTTARRRFIVTAGGALATAAAAAIVDAPHVIAQPKVQGRMSTGFTQGLIQQDTAESLGRIVSEMTGGRFRIEIFPGGQILPPLECFDAASEGKIDAFMASPSYYQGDGLKLMEETYGAFNLVPRPVPSVAPQMGGWFKKKINTIGDYKGLRMRIPSLGGQVVARAGGTAVLVPAAGIYAALERGVIDAAEWVGPHDDMKLGLHRTTIRAGTSPELGATSASTGRPTRRSLSTCAGPSIMPWPRPASTGLSEYHAKDAIALERLKTEFKGSVEVLQFPVSVLRDLRKLSAEVVKEQSEKTPMARKVHASFTKFQALVGPWDHIAEGAYHQLVAG
jgi:TRAP-type mannitol/chloroaromatic compound transport system substrate-binding protein